LPRHVTSPAAEVGGLHAVAVALDLGLLRGLGQKANGVVPRRRQLALRERRIDAVLDGRG
jgi:hypothetical protein